MNELIRILFIMDVEGSWRMGAKGAKQNQTKPNDSLHFVTETEIIIQNNNKNNKIKSNRVCFDEANFQLPHVIIISTGFGFCFNWFSGAIRKSTKSIIADIVEQTLEWT